MTDGARVEALAAIEKRMREEAAIWSVLKEHVGPKAIISSRVIAQIVGIRRKRKVREIIEAMVKGYRCPLPVIGVAGGGFYVSTDPVKIERYAANLYHLGSEIFRRRDGLLETARRCGIPQAKDRGQTELAFGTGGM